MPGRRRAERNGRPARLRPGNRLRGILSAAAFLVTACTVVPLLGPPPAIAANNGSFSVAPATKASFQRTYFTPVLIPGVTSRDSVAVINETRQYLTLDIYAADAFTTIKGGFAVKANYQPKINIGAWIHLPVSKVTIPPRSGEVIPFTYDPPANVRSGDYAGAIVAEETKGAVSGRGTLKIQSIQAVGAAVFARVVGPLHPRLAATDVSVHHTSPFVSLLGGPVNATVTYSLTNTGNEDLTPVVTVTLSGLVGNSVTHRMKLPQVLPGSTVTFSHTFDDVVPFGDLSATVVAHAKSAQTSGSAGAVVVPWLLLAIIVLLVLVVVYYRRRRSAQRGGKAEQEEGGTGGDRAAPG